MASKKKRWSKKLPYKEGDFFALPLERGGWGIGLLARSDGRGGVFCYIFGLRRQELPGLDELTTLRPEDAVVLARVGDLGFLEQEWKVIGGMPGWDRSKWPLPRFQRIDLINPRIAYVTEYSDDLVPVRETRCTPEEVVGLPRDSMHGYKSLEYRVDQVVPL